MTDKEKLQKVYEFAKDQEDHFYKPLDERRFEEGSREYYQSLSSATAFQKMRIFIDSMMEGKEMEIKIKKLNENAMMPTRGSEYAAGYDLYACMDEDISILPHETKKIGTGLSIEIPNGYFGAIFARSGIATKEGLRPANCVGVCDSDYRGEYIVAIHNDSECERVIISGERIAQLVVMPFLEVKLQEVEELGTTGRGDSGFGSTGK